MSRPSPVAMSAAEVIPAGSTTNLVVRYRGPADEAELVVKMLNSGAPGVMLDLEDSMANAWPNLMRGVANIVAALEGTLTYHELQGFLFAVACCPEPVAAHEWTAFVFSDGDPAYASEAEKDDVLTQLAAMYEEVSAAVAERTPGFPADCEALPDVMANFADEAPLCQWSRGFMAGDDWLAESWDLELPEDAAEALENSVMVLALFSEREQAEEAERERGHPREMPPGPGARLEARTLAPGRETEEELERVARHPEQHEDVADRAHVEVGAVGEGAGEPCRVDPVRPDRLGEEVDPGAVHDRHVHRPDERRDQPREDLAGDPAGVDPDLVDPDDRPHLDPPEARAVVDPLEIDRASVGGGDPTGPAGDLGDQRLVGARHPGPLDPVAPADDPAVRGLPLVDEQRKRQVVVRAEALVGRGAVRGYAEDDRPRRGDLREVVTQRAGLRRAARRHVLHRVILTRLFRKTSHPCQLL